MRKEPENKMQVLTDKLLDNLVAIEKAAGKNTTLYDWGLLVSTRYNLIAAMNQEAGASHKK